MTVQSTLTDKSIYDTRPVVEVDGEVNAMVQSLLTGMQMREQEGGLSSMELRFRNTATLRDEGSGYAFEGDDNELLSLGRPLLVSAGDRLGPSEIFRGTITAVEMLIEPERQPELVVLAEDDLMKARMSRKTRLFSDSSVGQVIESIAQEVGIGVSLSGLDQNLDDWLQHNETDLAFLRRLLARFDADMQMVEGELQVSPRAEVSRGELSLRIRSQLLSVRISADLAHQVSGISLAAWDPAQGEAIEVTSDQGADSGPGTGTSGKDALEDVLGERVEHLSGVSVSNQGEAQAVANAAFARRGRGFLRATGIAMGNPALRVGTHLDILGVGPRFENTYYVTETCHRYERPGDQYLTEFTAECGFLGPR